MRALEALQVSDKNGVATPADWPNNEIIGADVIVPPAKDVKTSRERIEKSKAGEFKCYDWWFCHKGLK